MPETLENKHLIVIAGPTGSGKTDLAIQLGKWLNTEIISADSRQIYKELHIGVAKPSSEKLALVPHHLIGHISVVDDYDAGKYENESLSLVNRLFQKYKTLILTGGSGLYIQALLYGLDVFPPVDPTAKSHYQDLFKEKGIQALQAELSDKDPIYYSQVDIQNPSRLIRALSVIASTDKPFSSFRKAKPKTRSFKVIPICLDLDRKILYEQINERTDLMIKQGLLKEVESLVRYKDLTALRTVGYSEIFDYLSGKSDLKTAIDLIKQNTRNYAKRQITWFRKYNWPRYHPENLDEIQTYLRNSLS